MSCLATKQRKHLIVTHEKGRSSHFTILQLNALLKQDSNKRNKLTLTKLNTIAVPFTLISTVANQHNEDYIALVGLKDCHIMYLNENGQTRQEIVQQNAQTSTATASASSTGGGSAAQTETAPKTQSGLIILHPSLEGSNYIIKALWLPGSQTELALVTSEFIKIYGLSVDKISPVYCFLLPMGKIKDVTFVYNMAKDASHKLDHLDSVSNEISPLKLFKYIVIMSSCGFLYYEEMNAVTSAKNGVYYITNTIEFDSKDIIGLNTLKKTPSDTKLANAASSPPPPPPQPATTNSQFGSGVSVYYSFKLQLLF